MPTQFKIFVVPAITKIKLLSSVAKCFLLTCSNNPLERKREQVSLTIVGPQVGRASLSPQFNPIWSGLFADLIARGGSFKTPLKPQRWFGTGLPHFLLRLTCCNQKSPAACCFRQHFCFACCLVLQES